jgi:hypothetical protein
VPSSNNASAVGSAIAAELDQGKEGREGSETDEHPAPEKVNPSSSTLPAFIFIVYTQ